MEMERETQAIFEQAGVHLNWRLRSEVEGEALQNLVVVRFNGRCIFEPLPYLYDERGPLAYTHTVDGAVLPFSEVACDNVTASIRSAMFGGDYAHADQLLGRALGRVVAHELVHILARSGAHGKTGVAEAALSGKQLIGGALPLDNRDLQRVR